MSVTAWDAAVQPALGGGCSTLDLLKRVPYANAREPAPDVSPTVRAEMLSIVNRRVDAKIRSDAHRASHHVSNLTDLGELVGRKKQPYVPGTPVTRKLKAGRLMRTDQDGEILASSRSAPVLPTHADTDTLDHALHLQQTGGIPSKAIARSRLSLPPEDPRTVELIDQRKQLEDKLLHVTQKICRKYTKQLFPKPARDDAPDHVEQLAVKWTLSDSMSEPERHALYMGGRFTTQHKRDFFERDLPTREPDSQFHKRDTAHTKYGDALVRGKHSLRANF